MSETHSSRFHGILTPLGNADFRNLLISNTLWWQAMWMEMIVVGWLVLELTDSVWQVGLVGFFRSVPLLITGFVAGPMADRFGRIRLILLSQSLSLIVIGVITVLIWMDAITYWHLVVGAAVFGTSWSFSWTARRALIPDLVGKNRIVDAMLLESFTQNISRVAGPFASGTLIAVLGALGCYVALLIISIVSFLIMLLVHRPVHVPPIGKETPWQLMTEGVRYVTKNQAIMGDLLITVAMNFLTFPFQTLLPVFARDILHEGPFELGLLGACNGIGAFFGLLIVNKVRHNFSRGWIFAIGSICQSVALLGFAIVSTFPLSYALADSTVKLAFPLGLLTLVIAGLGQSAFGVMQSAIVLLAARDDMRDRAMGTVVLAIGTGPFGRLQIGALAESFGAPLALGLQTSVAIVAIIGVLIALPGFRARLK
ncbi:MAG: MFS transporter [Candidatus Latescibacteria bacterium]|jgi:MFS family permease|nr:MFS transporter [Candidatus Latescibacterota bacterium]MBT5830709.1 MFS transporter [Candidatus Latescibacterota bacterium]